MPPIDAILHPPLTLPVALPILTLPVALSVLALPLALPVPRVPVFRVPVLRVPVALSVRPVQMWQGSTSYHASSSLLSRKFWTSQLVREGRTGVHSFDLSNIGFAGHAAPP